MERSEDRPLCRPATTSARSRQNWPNRQIQQVRDWSTPKAGPITVLTTAASANLTTPCGRSKTVVPPGNLIHKPGTAHSFERVAARDGERCGDIARSGNVHQKGTDKNCRPGSVTEHEQCRERNSRCRPHGRCTRVQRCQHQSELAGNEVDKR